MVALLGLVIGWGSVNFVQYLVSWAAPVKVQPQKISLGEVVEGEDVSFTVQIVNKTDQTLKLSRFTASTCGCFFEQQKLPQTIPPRTKVSFAIGLQSENLPEHFREHLTFILTTPSGKTFAPTVTLTGKVLKEITVNPSFIDFGTVVLGGVTTRTISLQSLTGQSFTIDGLDVPHEIEVSSPVSSGNEMQVQISFRPRERPGWREGKIKFRIKGFKRKEIVLPFKAIVEGIIDTAPNFLNFGLVKHGQVKMLTFRIINRSEKHLNLQLKSEPKLVKVEPTSQEGLEWSVTLKVPTNVSSSQILSGKIVFTTGVSIQPILEVPFFAAVENSNKGKGEQRR